MGKINITINMPSPEESRDALAVPVNDIFQKIADCLRDIEDGCAVSSYQWEYIKALYNKIVNKPGKVRPVDLKILDLIEATVHKYGQYDGDFASQMDGANKINKLSQLKEKGQS